jgi:hypothetical protein
MHNLMLGSSGYASKYLPQSHFSTDSALHHLQLLDSGLLHRARQLRTAKGEGNGKGADKGDVESEASEDSHISAKLVPRRRVGFLSASKDSSLQQFFNRYMLPTIFHPVGKIVVILIALVALIVGVIGATRVTEGLQYRELSPDGHFLAPFDDKSNLFQEKVGVLSPPIASQSAGGLSMQTLSVCAPFHLGVIAASRIKEACRIRGSRRMATSWPRLTTN